MINNPCPAYLPTDSRLLLPACLLPQISLAPRGLRGWDALSKALAAEVCLVQKMLSWLYLYANLHLQTMTQWLYGVVFVAYIVVAKGGRSTVPTNSFEADEL